MLIDDLSKLPDSFKEGYRGLLLIHRNKDGESGNAQRKSFKLISYGIEEWTQKILQLRYMQENGWESHRIYSSVNKRCLRKAEFEFKRRQLQIDQGDERNRREFYTDIPNAFFSCFMNSASKLESIFLLDCDNDEELCHTRNILLENNLKILAFYPTKNGNHILIESCNPSLLKWCRCEVKKDGLIYVG